MAQQQLLWLVFGIVVVGATVVAGTHVLGGPARDEDHTPAFQEALGIVSEIQLWKLKPSEVGGGYGADGFDPLTFRKLGYPHVILSNRVYKSEKGCYKLHTLGAENHAVLTLSSPSCGIKDYIAHVIVRGPGPGDLTWLHVPPG